MLLNINLKNFTIINELDLDFNTGMTALTGETGAGKSIIIDAIELALGARLDGKVVREDSDKADINVTFSIADNKAAKNWLMEKELIAEEECILRRIISKEGRSRSFINGHPVTLQLLNELGTMLINIHGQHEHQYLLKKDKQLQLLDAYSQNQDLLAKIKIITDNWRAAKKNFDHIKSLNRDQSNRREFLQFQLGEFAKLRLQDGEVEQLEQEHKKLANAESLLQNCQQSLSLISDNEININNLIVQALQPLASIKNIDPKIEASNQLLNEALIQIQEADNEIRYYLDKVDLNPQRLQEIDNRLALIHDLARKHRVNAKELTQLEKQLADELASLDNSDARLVELQNQLNDLEKQYLQHAKVLSSQRKKAAKKLTQLINADIQQLGMNGGQLDIKFQANESPTPNHSGLERIEFLVAANPGQSLQPLAKVASGGELSRISLAIQVNLAQLVQTPSMIFDEVDTGIGGGVAEIVGKLLAKLGEKAQVFCITHLPQVAAQAHHHLQVKKLVSEGKTSTTVELLVKNQRVEEIARMLGGIKLTAQTKAHAKEMLAS